MEQLARRIGRVSKLLLASSFVAYAISVALPALSIRHVLAGISWDTTVTGAGALFAAARWVVQFVSGQGPRATAMHLALGALNLIPVAALALWRLKGRRLVHTVPLVLVVAAFALWSMLPSSPQDVAAAREVWLILPGYHLWLWSLAGMSFALGMKWKSQTMLGAIWSRRPGARTCGWTLDPETLVHLPVAARALCHGAHRLRRTLERNPLGEDATREAWEWHTAAAELSDVDRTVLEDRHVDLKGAELALRRFWDAEAEASLGPLAEMDTALDHFVATATAPPKCTAFR